jgi:hypothetical protein
MTSSDIASKGSIESLCFDENIAIFLSGQTFP